VTTEYFDDETHDEVGSGAAAADQRQANLAAALRLAAAGLPIFPVKTIRNEAGEWKKPPLVKSWQQAATTNPEQIQQWWDEFPDAVPGIELGRSGLVAIDVDRHGGPDGGAAIEKLVAKHGNLPVGPKTETAGQGQHLIFKQPEGVQLGNGEGSLPDGINVRGAGGYIVGPGAVRPDGAIYEVAEGFPDLAEAFIEDTIPLVPDWLVGIIREDRGKIRDAGPAQDSGSAASRERAFATVALAECVGEIQQAARGTRNNTLNSVAYRLGRMVTRGWIEEQVVIDGLSQACHRNGLVSDDGMETVRRTIESGVTAGRAHPHSDLADRPFPQAESQPTVESPPLIPVVWDGQVKHNPTRWLVRDLIPMDSIGLIVGESTAGKSFTAIDLARALGSGTSFFAKRTRKGGTLYVAAEAAATIPGRLEAARLGPLGRFKDSDSEPDKLPVCLIPHPPGLLNDNEVNRLIATALDVSAKMQERFGVPLRLIIIDTLLAAFPINDWNSPAEVSRVMEILNRIAEKTGAVVLGVHHHGKDVSRGPAGSFALKAASDVVLAVFTDTDGEGNVSGRRMSVSKLRDGQTGWGCDFELVPYKLGVDDEGEDNFSCYLAPIVATAGFGRPRQGKPKNQSHASSAFEEAVVTALEQFGVNEPLNGNGPETRVVPLAKVREIFNQNYKPEGRSNNRQDALRSAFNRGLKEARQNKNIGEGRWNDTDWIWRP